MVVKAWEPLGHLNATNSNPCLRNFDNQNRTISDIALSPAISPSYHTASNSQSSVTAAMSLKSLPNEILIPILSHASKGRETDHQVQRAQAGLCFPWGPVETEALALLHFRTSVALLSSRLASLATQAFFHDRFTVVQLGWRDCKLVFTETEALGDFKQMWEEEKTRCAYTVYINVGVEAEKGYSGLATQVKALFWKCEKARSVQIDIQTSHAPTTFKHTQHAHLLAARGAVYQRLVIAVDEVAREKGIVWETLQRIEAQVGQGHLPMFVLIPD